MVLRKVPMRSTADAPVDHFIAAVGTRATRCICCRGESATVLCTDCRPRLICPECGKCSTHCDCSGSLRCSYCHHQH